MSYVPDCVKGSIVGALAMVIVMIVLAYLQYRDADLKVKMSLERVAMLTLLSMGGGCMILLREAGSLLGTVKGVLMLIYLMLCSITDWYMQQVYDDIQLYVCGMLAVITLWSKLSPALGGELIAFGLIQGLLFRGMYGEGDVMGFLICALSLVEKGIFIWVLHMGITYVLLGIIQGTKGNIGRDGDLRIPVPLFPYMACAYVFVF